MPTNLPTPRRAALINTLMAVCIIVGVCFGAAVLAGWLFRVAVDTMHGGFRGVIIVISAGVIWFLLAILAPARRGR